MPTRRPRSHAATTTVTSAGSTTAASVTAMIRSVIAPISAATLGIRVSTARATPTRTTTARAFVRATTRATATADAAAGNRFGTPSAQTASGRALPCLSVPLTSNGSRLCYRLRRASVPRFGAAGSASAEGFGGQAASPNSFRGNRSPAPVSSRGQDTWFSATGPGFESPYRYHPSLACNVSELRMASQRAHATVPP